MRGFAAGTVLALLAAPAWAEADMVVQTHVSTMTVNGGAGTQLSAECGEGETSLSASFVAEEAFASAPTGYRKARGVYAEGWRTGQTGWTFDVVNYGTRRDLRLTLSLMCYRGEVEELRFEE